MSHKIRSLVAVAVALAAVPVAAQTAWALRTVDPDTTLRLGASDPEASALDSLHQFGHLRAQIDSVARDTVFATAGEVATVRSLEVVGVAALDGADVRRGWAVDVGGRFSPRALSRALERSASVYAQAGYAEARLSPDVRVVDGGRGVEIVVRVDEGVPARVTGVELLGGRGAGRAFASRVSGVGAGTPAGEIDARRVRQSLDATGLYTAVGEPVLARTVSGDLVLQVPVEEAPPGTFDVVLGFLPPAGGASAQVVGSGRVDLRNVLGGGRLLHLQLVRNPGLVSTFDLAARDPFIGGSPLGLGARFEGASRDSTYSRQRLALDVTFPLAPRLTLIGSLSGESIRPGTFGAEVVDGRPRVRRTDALYVGAGIEYLALDAPRNPRRGLALAVSLDQGRPRRALADATGPEPETSVQRRLRAVARGYIPTLRRQVAVVGLDASLVQGAEGVVYDEAELFRIGGARSLRGYDEDDFLGSRVGRLFAEYRLQLDAEAYAFTFGDLGFVDRPALPGLAASRRVLPGYGAGVRLQTGIGLASISYALNPDLPSGRGKVHVGLAVGL